MSATKAVILARGLGTRMRAGDTAGDAAALTAEQAAVASTGLKAMIPVGDAGAARRPFLDYAISALADAGFTDVCLVIGPEHDVVRAHYAGDSAPTRVRLHFAVQARPLGTADAVLAAESFVADDAFVVLNGDNYYPSAVLAQLRATAPPATLAFSRAALLRSGAIPPERIAAYAMLEIDGDGDVRRVTEKPSAAELDAFADDVRHDDVRVSMNCWLFSAAIFRACREVAPSPRGELELPLAVQHGIDALGMRVRGIPVHAAVLDLSRRADVAVVTSQLATIEVRL